MNTTEIFPWADVPGTVQPHLKLLHLLTAVTHSCCEHTVWKHVECRIRYKDSTCQVQNNQAIYSVACFFDSYRRKDWLV